MYRITREEEFVVKYEIAPSTGMKSPTKTVKNLSQESRCRRRDPKRVPANKVTEPARSTHTHTHTHTHTPPADNVFCLNSLFVGSQPMRFATNDVRRLRRKRRLSTPIRGVWQRVGPQLGVVVVGGKTDFASWYRATRLWIALLLNFANRSLKFTEGLTQFQLCISRTANSLVSSAFDVVLKTLHSRRSWCIYYSLLTDNYLHSKFVSVSEVEINTKGKRFFWVFCFENIKL